MTQKNASLPNNATHKYEHRMLELCVQQINQSCQKHQKKTPAQTQMQNKTNEPCIPYTVTNLPRLILIAGLNQWSKTIMVNLFGHVS